MRISNKALIAITVVTLLLAAVSGILLLTRPASGTQVVVTFNGEVCGSYDLHKDMTIVLGPEDGSWHNTLQIKNGRAAIIESDCANQICVNTPPLNENTIGIIVCLPHGVAVELK